MFGAGALLHIGGPYLYCNDGAEISADSAIVNDQAGFTHLLGSVRYQSGDRTLRARELRYFERQGRILATGEVSLRDDVRGSAIEHGDLVLLTVTATRTEEEMTVTTASDGIRPIATLRPGSGAPSPDSISNEPPLDSSPYVVVGDRIYVKGESFVATGEVEIVRDSLLALGDSTEYVEADGRLHLAGDARVRQGAYELTGETIDMSSPEEGSSEIEARRSARLEGEDLDLTASRIRMFLVGEALDRLVATLLVDEEGEAPEVVVEGEAARPRAAVQDFILTADSLEVTAPNDAIERVFAAGTARSVSFGGDSLNVESLPDVARQDWLEGDTIVVTFGPSLDGDEGEMDVETIEAIVAARSLYRLPPSDSNAVIGRDPPALHYVTGTAILIEMEDGEIDGMEVEGQTRGVHLEPSVRRAQPRDTIATDTVRSAPADTLQSDTTNARDGIQREQPARTLKPKTEEYPWIRPG